MLNFTATSNDTSSCDACCCEPIYSKAGTVEKVQIDYADFSVPIGKLQCDTQFAIEKIQLCPTPPTGAATNTDYQTSTLVNTTAVVNLNAGLLPLASPVTFSIVPFQGPMNGTVTLLNGVASYVPAQNFTGYDTFWYKMVDAANNIVINQVIVQVRLATTTAAPIPFTAAVIVPTSNSANVNARMHFMSFPLNITPRACVGEVYRLTVRQGATDCNFKDCYHTTKCFDIVIGKC